MPGVDCGKRRGNLEDMRLDDGFDDFVLGLEVVVDVASRYVSQFVRSLPASCARRPAGAATLAAAATNRSRLPGRGVVAGWFVSDEPIESVISLDDDSGISNGSVSGLMRR